MMNYGAGPGLSPWSFGGNPPGFTGFQPYGWPAGFGGNVGWGGAGFGGFGGQYGPGYGPAPWSGYGTFPYGAAKGYGGNVQWTPMNDEELKYFVEGAIDSDPSIPPNSNIGVDVNNGIVTLTGTVPNKRIKHAVGDDAWWLPQVVDVHNEIMVTPRRERVGQTTTQPTSGTSARRGAGGQSR